MNDSAEYAIVRRKVVEFVEPQCEDCPTAKLMASEVASFVVSNGLEVASVSDVLTQTFANCPGTEPTPVCGKEIDGVTSGQTTRLCKNDQKYQLKGRLTEGLIEP